MADELNINLLKSDEEIRITVLTNICRMLVRRGYLDSKKYKVTKDTKDEYKYTYDDEIDNELFLNFFDKKRDDNTYEILLDNEYQDERTNDNGDFDGSKVIVRIISQKINDVKSSPLLNDFIKSYSKNHKIVISDVSEKALIGLSKKANLELFKEFELMIDVMSIIGSPLKISIEKEDRIAHILNTKIPQIYSNDLYARYLNAKRDDIICAILPNKSNPVKEYRRVKDPKTGIFI
jgi:DNA-directed RNA polymerase subunit H (RpoH/RPB5)